MTWCVEARIRVGSLDLDVATDGRSAPMAVVGPNGSGKTTLLRIIAGAHRPNSGKIVIRGRCFFDSERNLDLPSERRRVGYVPQGYGLFPHLRAVDNVAFGICKKSPKGLRANRYRTALAMLDELDCAYLAERFPRQLSGGEQQRVALARALVINPDILLLDEPLAAIDAIARRKLRCFLAERLRRFARPSIVVTHDLRDVVALNARVCVLENGRIVQQGSVDELRADPATDFIAELVNIDGMRATSSRGSPHGEDLTQRYEKGDLYGRSAEKTRATKLV